MESVYISGPYTATTKEQRDANVQRAKAAAQEFARKGYAVFCPHLQSHGWEDETDLGYDYFLTADLYWLYKCDRIVMLPGWKDSKGAKIEHMAARALGLVTYYMKEGETA